jgi:hypothetical protein
MPNSTRYAASGRLPFAAVRLSVLLLCSICAVAAPLSAAAAGPQKEEVTVSRAAQSLPGVRYAWVVSPTVLDAESDPRVQNAEFRMDLQAALDQALQAKGYRLSESASQADFLVAYRVGVRDLEEVLVRQSAPVEVPESAIVCADGDCSQLVTYDSDRMPVLETHTEEKLEAGLLVEVVEPRTIRVLWSAHNHGIIERRDVGKVHLDAVAEATLASLPNVSP